VSTRREFSVTEDFDGRRLDSCLADLHDGWTRSRVRKLIDTGCVTINNGPSKPSTRVRTGDLIAVDEPPPKPLDTEAQDIPLDVVYEDDELLVVNKPTGLVIHPAAGNPSGTLVNALLHHCTDLSGIGGVERPGIVHRLDKETTGLLVVAKSDRAHLALSLAFRQRTVHKTYLAVCFGVPDPPEGVVDAPIDRHPRERQRMAVVKSGRTARTRYHMQEGLSGASLLTCRPVTGRTHQIRVHMAHIGHALVGDPLYSGRQWRNLPDPRTQAACRHFPRQALHAWRLEFEHPTTRETVSFEAPIPDDIQRLLDVLKDSAAQR